MAISVNVTVVDNNKDAPKWNLDLDLAGKITLKDFQESFRNTHIKIAKEVLIQEQRKGFDLKPRRRIDNVFDKHLTSLRPFGKVEFFAKVVASEAVLGIYDEIEKRSPKGDTGLYARANYVLHNSKLIAVNRQGLAVYLKTAVINADDKIRFINVAPYSRMLELKGITKAIRGKRSGQNVSRGRRGKSAKTGNIISKPNGVYINSLRSGRSKYKAVANFMRFDFLPASTAGVKNLPSMAGGKKLRTRYTTTNSGRPYLYPTITIWFSQEGLAKGSGL